MTPEDEYAIASKLEWRRDGADWVLFHNRRRMGRVVPDAERKGMFRSVKSGGRLSDMANLSWSKDSIMGEAIRELAWDLSHKPARDPRKCPVNEGVERPRAPSIAPDAVAASIPAGTVSDAPASPAATRLAA